jgi:hypothetical protein
MSRTYARSRRSCIRRASRQYKWLLEGLRTDPDPRTRANRLDTLGALAEAISDAEVREPQSAAWATTADALRAVAASERFCILSNVTTGSYPVITGPEFDGEWDALAKAAIRGDRRERARILRGLVSAALESEEFAGCEFHGLFVLNDIAETELAIAGPLAAESGVPS